MHPLRSATYLIVAFLLLGDLAFAQVANFKADVAEGCFPLTVQFTDTSTGTVTNWSWDFGNQNTSELQNPQATYSQPGTYNVSLTVSNGGGTPSTFIRSAYIIVHDFPSVDFSFDIASGCAPLTVKFKDNTSASSGQIVSWDWVFGDGGHLKTANPTYTFNQPGAQSVSLRVKNEFGCEQVKSLPAPITILGPKAQFAIDKSGACTVPATFQFTNQSTGTGLSYQWDFGDGQTSTSQSPSHTYSRGGTFNITLKTKDSNGCMQSTQKSVNVGGEGGLDFTATPSKVCLGDPIDFELVSTDAPINATWNFDDGNTAGTNDVTYTYQHPGTYNVTLTSLLLNHSCPSFISKTIIVAAPAQPKFTSSMDCSYNLTLTSTSKNTSRVEWYVEDKLTSGANAFVSPVHNPGLQDIKLVAYDVAGCFVELDTTVNIPANPVASFSPNKQQSCDNLNLSGCAPFNIDFTNTTVSTDPITYNWDFGDGASSTEKDPHHTYTKKGLYQITMTATNTKGCSGSVVAFAIVADQAPVADFEINKTEACAGEDVTFTDKSTGADYWCWDFGNGDSFGSSDPTVLYKYPRPGTYSVTLTAKNAGCTSQIVKVNVITIKDPLVTYNVHKTCADPHTIQLTNHSANYDAIHWDFGDGQTSTVVNVGSHHYDDEGTYTLKLIGTNNATGCTTIAYEPIVIQDINADFEMNTTHPCKGSPILFTDKSHAAVAYDWTIAGVKYTDPDPSMKIKIPGAYSALLNVVDSDGCHDTKTVAFTVVDMEGDFNYTASSTCDDFIVDFKNLSTGTPPPTGWLWDFGDGGTSTDRDLVYTYRTPGKYTVSLTVTNSDGSCTFSKEDAVNFTVPIPGFETAKTEYCQGETVIAANTTKNANLYEWDYGDGRRSDFVSPSIVYNNTGSYNITLFATDAYGCERKFEKDNAVVIERPAASFTVSASRGDCPPFTASFADHSQSNIKQWNWDFGDGNTSVIQNPANVYLEPGAFNVKLTVTDNNGCSDTKTANQFVMVGGPSGTFAPDAPNSCTNYNVSFTANTTNTSIYKWDFGDGVVKDTTVSELTHVYRTTGDFTPALILIDSRGCKTVAKGSSLITIKDTTKVSANFSPRCINIDEPFTLVGKNDGDTDDDIMWTWEIDGVVLGSGDQLQATIHEPGVHLVRGRASNKYNCVSNTVDSIRVQGPITQIPNIITPNNDFANQTFRIIGLENSIWNIDIVNRWGSLVYRKNGYQGDWDGGDQPAGVYYYILSNAICDDVSYKGYISVAK